MEKSDHDYEMFWKRLAKEGEGAGAWEDRTGGGHGAHITGK